MASKKGKKQSEKKQGESHSAEDAASNLTLAMQWSWSYEIDEVYKDLFGLDDEWSKRIYFDRQNLSANEIREYPNYVLQPPPHIDNGAGRPMHVVIDIVGAEAAFKGGYVRGDIMGFTYASMLKKWGAKRTKPDLTQKKPDEEEDRRKPVTNMPQTVVIPATATAKSLPSVIACAKEGIELIALGMVRPVSEFAIKAIENRQARIQAAIEEEEAAKAEEAERLEAERMEAEQLSVFQNSEDVSSPNSPYTSLAARSPVHGQEKLRVLLESPPMTSSRKSIGASPSRDKDNRSSNLNQKVKELAESPVQQSTGRGAPPPSLKEISATSFAKSTMELPKSAGGKKVKKGRRVLYFGGEEEGFGGDLGDEDVLDIKPNASWWDWEFKGESPYASQHAALVQQDIQRERAREGYVKIKEAIKYRQENPRKNQKNLQNLLRLIDMAEMTAENLLPMRVSRWGQLQDEAKFEMARSKGFKQLSEDVIKAGQAEEKEELVEHDEGRVGDKVKVSSQCQGLPLLQPYVGKVGVLTRKDEDFEGWWVDFTLAFNKNDQKKKKKKAPAMAKKMQEMRNRLKVKQNNTSVVADDDLEPKRHDILFCTGHNGRYWISFVEKIREDPEEDDPFGLPVEQPAKPKTENNDEAKEQETNQQGNTGDAQKQKEAPRKASGEGGENAEAVKLKKQNAKSKEELTNERVLDIRQRAGLATPRVSLTGEDKDDLPVVIGSDGKPMSPAPRSPGQKLSRKGNHKDSAAGNLSPHRPADKKPQSPPAKRVPKPLKRTVTSALLEMDEVDAHAPMTAAETRNTSAWISVDDILNSSLEDDGFSKFLAD